MFASPKPVIGMLHVPALPGSPAHQLPWPAIRERVRRDAETLASGGVDGLLLENFGDAPFYPNRVPTHTVAFLAVLGHEIKASFPLPLGVNVLRNDAASALAVAAAVDAQFIRVNVYSSARLTDQGLIQGEAHELLRYRKLLGAAVQVFADVDVKHSVPLGPRDLPAEVADTIERGRADAVIVSGPATGKETRLLDLRLAKEAAGATPVFVGSGARPGNVRELLRFADGLIAGSSLQQDGIAGNPVDAARVRALVEAVRSL
jgi:hypothetical protein